MPDIPLSSAEKLLRSANEDMRIAESAKIALRNFLHKETKRLSKKAVAMAKHCQRNTVLKEDMQFVIEHFGQDKL